MITIFSVPQIIFLTSVAILSDTVRAFAPKTASPRASVLRQKHQTTHLDGSVVDLTDENFSDLLFGRPISERPSLTLVDCYAPWCGPCKLLEPVLEQVADLYDREEQLIVCRYDVQAREKVENGDDSIKSSGASFKLELALQGCMVRALPALVVLDSRGRVLEHWEGLQKSEFIQQGLQPHLVSRENMRTVTSSKQANNGKASSRDKGLVGLGTWQQQEEDSYMLTNPLI